jgi:hypothetical protein
MNNKIYCFGDSHISNFVNTNPLIKEMIWYENDLFAVNRLGPYLAYNLNDKIAVFNQEILKVQEQIITMLFSFGEIDCRAQVQKQSIIRNISIDEIIIEIVERYFEFINIIKNKHGINNIIIFGIVPCFYENPFQEYYLKHPDDFDCPRGTLEERQSYKKKYNQLLKENCVKNKFSYLSLFDDVFVDGEVDKKYRLDEIHLNPETIFPLILQKFTKNE